ncbi:pyridoxamine 5'-phosphate oxidase family protein [Dactylosporangium sp. NPDC005572]|uniref:pyridoxamine 5'-phosphate oxidase family protein n=1 Tax=Dactylosporangium sp. NPDC005572 TaxID=3156889 RepID=UPI0033A3089F
MSIRFTPDEAWAFVERAHTGILTTLRADGWPVTLPVWFVVLDRTICCTTPAGTKKVARVRRDPRAAFLAESGHAWAELAAVHLTGTIAVVTDEPTESAVRQLFEAKYAPSRVAPGRLPQVAQRHYSDQVTLRFTPDDRILSWDNGRIALRD